MRLRSVVAIDLGGTNVRLGIVDSSGRVRRRRRLKMTPFERKDELCRWLAAHVKALVDGEDGLPRPGAVGIGFAGPAKAERGLVYYAPNVGRLENIEVGRYLRRSVGLPTVVENDANCAAVGEYWRGAGRGARSLFMFTVGTGIGGSFLIDGEVWHGADGIAGEIGHTVVAAGGPVCNCGARGCLEALVSAWAIVRDYNRPVGRSRPPKAGSAGAKIVFDMAKRGDRRAQRAIEHASRALGLGIANVFHLLNPDLILIGGGVSRAGAVLLKPALEEARRSIFPPLRERLTVRRATLRDDAGLLGAAQLALRELKP